MRAALSFPAPTLLRAQGRGGGVRLALFDVDGVLTDGSLWIGAEGELLKPFNSLDGHGLKSLLQVGIVPVIVTGRDSPAVRRRVADLGLPQARYGAHDKLAVAQAMLDELQVAWDEVAVMGDDWPDLPLMQRAAFACAPPNAHIEVRKIAHHVTAQRGGEGAAREFCDLLLMAAGQYHRLLEGQMTTLDGR